MDDARFDALTRSLTAHAGRRRLLGALLGGALAPRAGTATAAAGPQAADCTPDGRRCGPDSGNQGLPCSRCCSRFSEEAGDSRRCACKSVGRSCSSRAQCCTGLCGGTCCSEEVLDTVVVPSNGDTVASAETLEQGVRYLFRASGTFANGTGGGTCDTEFCTGKDYCGAQGEIDVGIGIDNPTVDRDKGVRWRRIDGNHRYEARYTGKGAPVEFTFYDCNYNDNTGNLRVEIFACA